MQPKILAREKAKQISGPMQRFDMTFRKQKKIPQVKICGLTRPQDLAVCHDLGVDYIGFNLHRKSKRYVDPSDASGLWQSFIRQHPTSTVTPVLVCVDADMASLKLWTSLFPENLVLQLHGKETSAFLLDCKSVLKRDLWKAVAVIPDSVRAEAKEFQPVVQRVLLDSPVVPIGSDVAGGSGTAFRWQDYVDLIEQSFVGVAGGVNPDNVDLLLKLNPSFIDVASGCESAPGIKDSAKIQRLVSSCRKAFQ